MIVPFHIEIPLLGNPFQALNISRDGIEVLFLAPGQLTKELKFQIETLEVEPQVDLPPQKTGIPPPKRKNMIFRAGETMFNFLRDGNC